MPIRLLNKRLSQMRDSSVDQALAAALPTVGPKELAPLAQLLLSRGDAGATASLIEHFPKLPEDLQSQLISRINDLHGACREAARKRGSAGPKVVIDLVRRTRSFKLVYLIAEQLRTGPVELRRAAAACLLELTEYVSAQREFAQEAGLTSDVEGLEDVQSAVEEGLLLYRHHHQPEILLAFAMLLPGPCEKAMVALRDARQPAVEGLRQLILDAHEPAIIRHTLRWLTVVTLQPVVTSVLSRLCRAGKLAMILEQGELLELASVKQSLSRLSNPDSLLPTDEDIASMVATQAKWLPLWITSLPLDQGTCVAQLARLIASPHTAMRLAALNALINMPSKARSISIEIEEALHDAVATFCFDVDAQIAELATRHLMSIAWSGLHRLLLKLNQASAHESLRTLAADVMLPLGFGGLWRKWPKLDPHQRLSSAKALIKLNDRFYDLMGKRLSSDDVAIQLRALDMIVSLNQGPIFEDALLELAQSDDDKIAASAVRALASVTSHAATQALEAALSHAATRVRANAIEALDLQRISQSIALLRTMATSEENRPRANAIAQLLRAGDAQAPSQMRSMLSDAQPMHRISALWAAQREGRLDVVGDVAEMVISDRDAQVRQRAAKTLKQLLMKMQVKPAMAQASSPEQASILK